MSTTVVRPHMPDDAAFSPKEGPLHEANKGFHASYDTWIRKTMAGLGRRGQPVIFVRGDEMKLMHDNVRETVTIIPEPYHRLKAVGHVPLGLFTVLRANEFGPLSPGVVKLLEKQREILQQAHDILPEVDIPRATRPSHQHILEVCLELTDEVLAAGEITEEGLQNFVDYVLPYLMEGAKFAAEIELNLIHEHVTRWRADMTDEEWHATYVVIAGGHQARYRETSQQYFHRLLGEELGQGAQHEDHVIYAEGRWEEFEMLMLLAKHINDQRTSMAFFGVQNRMQEEFLADAAAYHVNKLLPEEEYGHHRHE